jgi:hypothetical protein
VKTDQMYFNDTHNPFTQEFQLEEERLSKRQTTDRNILSEIIRLRDN